MRDRVVRDASLVGAGVLLFQALRIVLSFFVWPGLAGMDYAMSQAAASRWLAGGGFYLPEQLVGPYTIRAGDVLYPPVALWLFAPFTILPAVLWWAIPAGLIAWSVFRLRPARWTWPVIAAISLVPHSWQQFLLGNPSMWVLAFGFLGAVYGWPSVFVLLKPTLAPFALYGADRRTW